MEINVNDDKHTVEIWLNHQEQQNVKTDDFIKVTANNCLEMNYKLAVFRSGCKNVVDCTDGLLKKNLYS